MKAVREKQKKRFSPACSLQHFVDFTVNFKMYKGNFTYGRNVLNGVYQFGNGNSSEKEEE